MKAHNVIIENCVFDVPITPGNWYCIVNTFNNDDGTPMSTNLTIRYCEIRGGNSSSLLVTDAIVLGNNISECGGDAIKCGSNCYIGYNIVRNIGKAGNGVHADALQMVGGHHTYIYNNWFDIPISNVDNGSGYASNACLMLNNANSPLHHIYIFNNIFEGGNYTVFIKDKDPNDSIPSPYRISLRRNMFGTDYRYGPLNWTPSNTILINSNIWQDGTWMDINSWDNWPNL